MKIAVIIDTWFPFVGGGQINAWEISKRLADQGIEVEIVTRDCGTDNHKANKNLQITKLGKTSKVASDMARLKFLLQSFIYLIKGEQDLIIVHAFLPGLVAKIIMLLKNIPTVMVVHGTSIKSNLNNGIKSYMEKYILTKITYSAQITVSRDFLKLKNVNKHVVYIPNGVDKIFFKQHSKVNRVKNSLLFAGRLHPQKNLINLIHAIRLLELESFPVKLTVIGDGPQKKEILNLIKKYKLERSIKLEGAKYGVELVKYFHSSSVLILPSIYEGQPLTLLEAWAAKLPVIVSKTGDNTYLVKDGKNGYFIKNQKNPGSIAEAIKRTFRDKNLSKLGQNGYMLVKNNLSWEISTNMTQQLLMKLSS